MLMVLIPTFGRSLHAVKKTQKHLIGWGAN